MGKIQVICLGANGGPSETGLSSILVRGGGMDEYVAVDAGCHLGAIADSIEQSCRRSAKDISVASDPFGHLCPGVLAESRIRPFAEKAARKVVVGSVYAYLITHAHLDHVAGMVVNSPVFVGAARRPKVVGLKPTLDALNTHVFNGVIWPPLMQPPCSLLEPVAVECASQQSAPGPVYHRVGPSISTMAFSITHGSATSTAFFVRVDADASSSQVLIFGDVEPDSISKLPRNGPVWAHAADLFRAGQLKAIFIECSYDDSRDDGLLFGHMSPRHLVDELVALGTTVTTLADHKAPSTGKKRKSGPVTRAWTRRQRRKLAEGNAPTPTPTVDPLADLTVFIIHIKHDDDASPDQEDSAVDDDVDVEYTILDQIRRRAKDAGLDCRILAAHSGKAYDL